MSFASRVLIGMGEAFRRRAGDLLSPIVEALSSGVDAADSLTGTDADPWPSLFNLDTTPYPAWLGQATGTSVPGGLTLEAQRAYVRERPNDRRGHPDMIRAAVAATLTGSQTVEIVERSPDPDHIVVRVYASEVVDLAATNAAYLSQKPVGLLPREVTVLTGATWEHMTTLHGPTWVDFMADFPTWADARDHTPE